MICKTIIPMITMLVAVGASNELLAQTYSPMIPPAGATWRNWYYCIDQYTGQIAYYCGMTLEVAAYTNTNAHYHGPSDSSHPRSTMTCVTSWQCTPSSGTSINGNTLWVGSLGVDVRGSLVGQAERIYVSNPYGSVTTNCAVGYTDLYYNDHPEIWVRIGGTDTGVNTGHGVTYYNRYMTYDSAVGLYYASQEYLVAHMEISKICTNDMALPFGGKFDICPFSGIPGCPAVTPWASPHASHDRGTAADVAGTGSTQCSNYGGSGVNISEFIARCVAHGAYSTYSINESNHAHCQFSDPNVWPH
ncbi:MAG: hypothetical protein LAP87_26250 [Acidobacteriia bacterium]|nr:hypothetical protein [Terriglobia bacterium]